MGWRERVWARERRRPASPEGNRREIRAMIADARATAGGRLDLMHFSVAMKKRYDLAALPTLRFCRSVLEASGVVAWDERSQEWKEVEAA